MNKSITYDIAVVGAGPAGTMAAIRASGFNKKILIIERNPEIGKKIFITGKGRCNLTNKAPIDVFIEKFGRQGLFFRPAFYVFSNTDLIDFFEENNLKLKIERQGRIFPVTNRASSVIDILKKNIRKNRIDIFFNTRLNNIKRKGGIFFLYSDSRDVIKAERVILALGGASFGATGSKGDGFLIAKKLGHRIVPLTPGLVPLKVKEQWVKKLQGLALKNIRLVFSYGRKKIISNIGELMFTHFGVSGPLVLDLSGRIVSVLKENKTVNLSIDLKVGLDIKHLEQKLLRDFIDNGSMKLKNAMNLLLPKRLVPVFIYVAELDENKRLNQITHKERNTIIQLLKSLPMTITGSLPLKYAMVTQGGVSTKEINPKTMESKIVPGLFFAGEIIDGAAPSGGYNLQQAFSTGFLAGQTAGNF